MAMKTCMHICILMCIYTYMLIYLHVFAGYNYIHLDPPSV